VRCNLAASVGPQPQGFVGAAAEGLTFLVALNAPLPLLAAVGVPHAGQLSVVAISLSVRPYSCGAHLSVCADPSGIDLPVSTIPLGGGSDLGGAYLSVSSDSGGINLPVSTIPLSSGFKSC
jgi:hypothetical protein